MRDLSLHVATYYGVDPALLDAIVDAEGGEAAYIKAIRCSRPDVSTFPVALAVGCKTIRNFLLAEEGAGTAPVFCVLHHADADPWTHEANPRRLMVSDAAIDALAAHWAPVGAANDPSGLNANWAANVKALYRMQVDRLGGAATRG